MKAYLGIDIGSISTKGVIINEENKILCYGIDELMKVTGYPYSIQGLYNYIYRNEPLRYGPYKGYHISQLDLIPAFINIR